MAYVAGWRTSFAAPGESAAEASGRQLVSSGVQSITICDKHHARVMDHLAMRIPGVDAGVWGPKKRGNCHVWYHYADSEE